MKLTTDCRLKSIENSPNLAVRCSIAKKAFHLVLSKKQRAYVGEIQPWGQFHQLSTRADPESAKKTLKLFVFFTLLGSAFAKAACRMLMKLTSGVPNLNP